MAKTSGVFEVIRVEHKNPMLGGIYIRERGEVEQTLKMNTAAFVDIDDCEACAGHIAKFLTQAMLWS